MAIHHIVYYLSAASRLPSFLTSPSAESILQMGMAIWIVRVSPVEVQRQERNDAQFPRCPRMYL